MKPILMVIVWLAACGGGDGDDGIVDIGKSCASAGECDHVCTMQAGASAGQCSIECTGNSDCPSFMDCIESSSTGERRCFDLGGVVGTTLLRQCEQACSDVDYFCSDSTISDAETDLCNDFCSGGADPDLEAFVDCVNEAPRYTSTCPAAECVLERI